MRYYQLTQWISPNIQRKPEAIRLANIWASIPGQLARENKRFNFARINKNARAREYNESIQWLVDAGLVKKVNNIKTPKLPLSGYQENKFKLYLLDIGLLGAMNQSFRKKLSLKEIVCLVSITGHLLKTMWHRSLSFVVREICTIGRAKIQQKLILLLP